MQIEKKSLPGLREMLYNRVTTLHETLRTAPLQCGHRLPAALAGCPEVG